MIQAFRTYFQIPPAVSNVQSLVFCSIFGCSLFVFFVFWPLYYLMSHFISANVFLQSSWHCFNWKLLKHSDVAVRGVNIGLCIPSKWQPSPLKHRVLSCAVCLVWSVYIPVWYYIMWLSLSVTCDRSLIFSATNKSDLHDIVEIKSDLRSHSTNSIPVSTFWH
jgi:hypothetical protein